MLAGLTHDIAETASALGFPRQVLFLGQATVAEVESAMPFQRLEGR